MPIKEFDIDYAEVTINSRLTTRFTNFFRDNKTPAELPTNIVINISDYSDDL